MHMLNCGDVHEGNGFVASYQSSNSSTIKSKQLSSYNLD